MANSGTLVRITTYVGLPAEDVRRDTRHLVTASAFQIKQKLVRGKIKHGPGIQFHVVSHPQAPHLLLSNNFGCGLNQAHAQLVADWRL